MKEGDAWLDVLYFKHLDVNTKFPNLSSVLKIFFVLTHGQASVEHGFSINKSMFENNITEAYVMSHRLIKDYLSSNQLKPKDVKIAQGMVLSVKSARTEVHSFYGWSKKTFFVK